MLSGRWLALCNPSLTQLLRETIDEDFLCNLELIAAIREFAEDPGFQRRCSTRRSSASTSTSVSC